MNCGKHSHFGGKFAFPIVMTVFDKIGVKHYLWIIILHWFYSHLPDFQNLSAQIIVVTKWTEKK